MVAPEAGILPALNSIRLQDPMVVGNGGRGGHIILKGNRNLWTLLHLRYFKNVLAENGEGGMKNNMSGRDGKDISVRTGSCP